MGVMAAMSSDAMLRFAAMGVMMVFCFVEFSIHHRLIAWYYGVGPALLCERWQTSGTVEQVREAIRAALNTGAIIGRESAPKRFCVRKYTIERSPMFRILLDVEESTLGAAVRFEVRPVWSMYLMYFPAMWALLVGRPWPEMLGASFGGILLVVVVLWSGRWRDIQRIGRLPALREALAPLGLRICERCGYDLFGLAPNAACPECGEASSGKIPRAHM